MNEIGKMSLSWNIITNANIGIWIYEQETGKAPKMYVDEKMAELIGVSGNEPPEEIFEKWHQRTDPQYLANLSDWFQRMLAGEHAEIQYLWHHPDGRTIVTRCGGARNFSYKEGIRIEGCHQDVTKLVQLQKFHTADFMAALADQYSYLFFIDPVTLEYDVYSDIDALQNNNILRKRHGTDYYQDIVADIKKVVCKEDWERAEDAFLQEKLLQIAETGKSTEIVLRWNSDGKREKIWVRNKLFRFIDEIGNVRIVVGIEDITEQTLKEEQILEAKEIERKSLIDPLTGCNNRLALEWAYNGGYGSQTSVTVISCDLNGLKRVNDKDGHGAGDRFICNVANLLVEVFGKQCVYRIGGDEFVVVLLSLSREEVDRLLHTLREEEHKREVSISVGMAYSDASTIPFEQLLLKSDQNMYEEKRAYYMKTGIDRRNRSEMHRRADFIDAMVDFGASCYLALKINLTTDSYEIIHAMDGYDTSFRDSCKSLTDFLTFPVRESVMHRDDVDDYCQYTSLEFLRNFAKVGKGRTDHWVRYRSKYRRENYHLIELQFFFGRDYSEQNQAGYLIMKDKGEPFSSGQVRFGEVLKGLSEGFDSIFYVDFKEDIVHPYRISRELDEKMINFLKSYPKYWTCMKMFIRSSVCSKDRELMKRTCRPEYIKEQFKLRKSFTQDFRSIKNGNEVFYRVKFAHMGNIGEPGICVIGFENINRETMFSRDFQNLGDHLLIVEKDPEIRKLLHETFREQYDIFDAEDSAKAFHLLEDYYEEIALVMTDFVATREEDYELIQKMRQDRRMCSIPIIVTTDYGEDESRVKCLELGASDFVGKPYDPEVVKSRVANLIKLRGVTDTLSRIEIDSVTGLYSKEAFFNYAQNILDHNPEQEYSVVVSDIVGFRMINEQYGMEAGNKVLNYVANAAMINEFGPIIGGRIGSDVMAVLVPEIHLGETAKDEYVRKIAENAPVSDLILKYGVYHTYLGRNVKIQQMCDRARMAVTSIKGEYDKFFATYDENMGQNARMEQMILKNMVNAIEKEQLEIYYQPKFDVQSGQIAGAEALVRWIHPDLGFMNPGVFISIFEKNGFIRKMDRYVWNKVCADLAAWRAKGVEIPVSVNVSRRDFVDLELAQYIIDMTDSYKIPHHLLHIEVTESAYSERPEVLKETIGKLHQSGFIIELDDFGTGYSSITALNGMDIDILKLDLSIIRDDTRKKEGNVLDFTMGLARMMQIQTVQEGVETQEQFERVKSLGCTYVQGYYFAKPLPKKEFTEKYINCK